jgi:hypothetical protein
VQSGAANERVSILAAGARFSPDSISAVAGASPTAVDLAAPLPWLFE